VSHAAVEPVDPADAATPLADRLAALLHRLDHVLPSQAPIRDFVHHNTLHGLQHLPFHEALRTVHRELGIRAYLPAAEFRQLLAAGRITRADIDVALDAAIDGPGASPDEPDALLVAVGERRLTRRDLRWLAMRHDLAVPAPATLAARLADPGFDAALFEATARGELPADDPAHDPFIDSWSEDAAWESLAAEVGPRTTLRGLLVRLTGEDAFERVRPLLVGLLGNALDLGQAGWHSPHRKRGLYASFRAMPTDDPIGWGTDEWLPEARREIAALPDDPLDTIAQELMFTGVDEARWMDYLQRLALELPGWSGMVLWRHMHPDYRDGLGLPVSMFDYLAIRLVLERLATQDIIRRHWQTPAAVPALGTIAARLFVHPGELRVRLAARHPETPEALAGVLAHEVHLAILAEKRVDPELASRVEDVAPAVRTARRQARRWPVHALLRHAGWHADDARALGATGLATLAAELQRFDEDAAGRVWLEAYEHHYRERIFAVLAANHGRFPGHAAGHAAGHLSGHAGRPSAQVVFCMDEREEGMRRHLEEVAPEVETLGVAAHFGVFQNWCGLDDAHPTPLAPVVPVVVRPAHAVQEVARDEAAMPLHRQRHGLRQRLLLGLHAATRQGGLRAALLAIATAPAVLFALLARSLAPGRFGGAVAGLRQRFEATPPTRLAFTAADDAPPASPDDPRPGFTAAEQAERIGNFLRGMGLTRNFAPLVVINGHGSNSRNNPHASAYDCGACAGRHSGPNARLFAAMANHPPVRQRLAAAGIVIPDDTWFIGAEHNTCDDGTTWYDAEDIPAAQREAFARLDRQMAEAARRHAQERCRRLASAPLSIAPDAALRHVRARRQDLGQPRPELGHVTNACALIGRRKLSRGAFFDRRAFMISYDPTSDPEGAILERLLLANGPVGAGISLEYYFSTVNNEQFGCGTKIVHNVAGLFGVLEGASSDLRTGLPKQMIEIHEAMRLLVVVEQKAEVVTAIYQRQPPLQELIGQGWIVVAAKDPESAAIHRFVPGRGWVAWSGHEPAPAEVERSHDWFAGHRHPLPPVLLRRPLATAIASASGSTSGAAG
jgi:uncharacterized protein YbcC (UPF0753/DUF2309 family)